MRAPNLRWSAIRPAIWTMVGCLTALVIYAAQQSSHTGQEDNGQHPANQQESPDATPHEEVRFNLLIISNCVTESGAWCGGKTYETPSHTKLYLTIVHLGSREGAKKEYDEWIRKAVRIIDQGKVQDKPATKSVTTEDRAEIIVLATRDCKEATTIIGTAGTVLRIISSCSSKAALEFEKAAKRAESENDQHVVR